MATTTMTAGGHYDYGNYLNNYYYAANLTTASTTTLATTWNMTTTASNVVYSPRGSTNVQDWQNVQWNITYEPIGPKGPPKKESFIKESRLGIKETNMSRKRLVQVFIVDPDDRIDDEHSVLHQSEILLTSKTNEELLFDTPVKTLLEDHNKYRKTVVDEEASDSRGRDVHLRVVKVRDLEMKVVVHAEF